MRIFLVILLLLETTYSLGSGGEPFPEPTHPQEIRNLLPELEPDHQEALQFIYNLGPYDTENYEGLGFNDFYVVAGNREVADACLSLLADERFLHYWKDAFHALGIMASVEPDRVDFQRLTNTVEQLENSELPEGILMRTLSSAYISVARFGNSRSEGFLAPRMTEAFWEDKRKLEQNWGLVDQEDRIYRARELAVMNFNSLGEDSGIERLKELVATELEDGGEALERAIGIVERNSPSRRSTHERNVALYQEWQEKFPGAENEPDTQGDERNSAQERDVDQTEEQDSGIDEEQSEGPVPQSPGEQPEFGEGGASRWPWTLGVLVVMLLAVGVLVRRSRTRGG